MFQMKHLLPVLAALLALSLCACGHAAPADPPAPSDSVQEEYLYTGIPDEEFDDEWLTEDEEFIPPACAVDDECDPEFSSGQGLPSAEGLSSAERSTSAEGATAAADEIAPAGPGGDVESPPQPPVPVDPNDPLRDYIIVQISDAAGNPVPYVSGSTARVVGDPPFSAVFTGEPDKPDQLWSGEDGRLYLHVDKAVRRDMEENDTMLFTLRAYHNPNMLITLQVTTPVQVPGVLSVRWDNPLPPSEPIPQLYGLCLQIVDAAGSPVEGVTLTGSPYPVEYFEAQRARGLPVSDEQQTLGPSDADGIIRWHDARDGTFHWTAQKNGAGPTQEYEVLHPYMNYEEITLIWTH